MGRSQQLELGLGATPSAQLARVTARQATAPASRGTVTVHIDGASKGNPGLAAIGVVISQHGHTLREVAEIIGDATNNVAEYNALIVGLETALELGRPHVRVFSDSELLVRQVNGEYKVKSPLLAPLFGRVQSLIRRLESFELTHIDRAANAHADKLANQAITAHFAHAEHKGPKQTG